MASSGRVCARCAQIKQRCDGNTPCSRCARLGHVCEPQLPGKRSEESKSQAYRRPRASRSRSGCLSCKARKKKCDELRPRCSDCRRLNLPCRWKALSPHPNSPPNAGEGSPSHVLADDPQHGTSDGNLFQLPVAFEDPQSLTINPITVTSDEQASSPEEDPHPTLLDTAIATTTAAPNAATWLTPDTIIAAAAVGPVASPMPVSANPHLHTEEDRSLFNHYLHIVARALSRSVEPDGNPFLTTLLPMAAASDTLTSVILGLSGGHWKRVYPSIWNRALARQGRALAQVNSLLSRQDIQSTIEACATVLLLCLTELFDGTSRVWKWHLKAASTLLRSAGVKTLECTPEGAFCLRLFHYLDSMSTISRCKPPLLRDGESLSDLTTGSNAQSNLIAPSLANPRSIVPRDPISGMAPALLDFLGMVNLLAAHRDRRVDELSDIGFRTAAAHVQTQLDAWRAQYDSKKSSAAILNTTTTTANSNANTTSSSTTTTSSTSSSSSSQSPPLPLGWAGLGLDSVMKDHADQATTAFEWAIRLRLHQIVDGYDPHHVEVETAIAMILSCVLAIPYGSPVEGSLLFPLVIAGASSTNMERRMVVKERLMVMEHTLGFGHIARARQLLETMWAQDREWNWASVRYTQFPGMVFI